MASPGQKRGSCGHAMAGFDGHAFCARCREKGKGEEPCIANKETTDCKFCNLFTPEQRAQISTPSYKIKKEKREAKRLDNSTPTEEIALVDPASVSVIGAVGESVTSPSTSIPPEKKAKKDKPTSKANKSASSSADDRISALDLKWSDRFNRLEALLMAKSLEPSFSADVRVTPKHSPPANVSKDSEPFFQPTNLLGVSSQRTGPDTVAASQPSAGKLPTDKNSQTSSTRTGPDVIAPKQKSAGKPKADTLPAQTASGRTGPDVASSKHKSTGKPHSDSHRTASSLVQKTSKALSDRPGSDRPSSASHTGSDSPTLHKSSGRDSISSMDSDVESTGNLSDDPPLEIFVEEGELSDDQELMEQDTPTSEEQTYRETMRGIRAFMGWSHVPEIDSSNPSDDNPFAGPKAPAPSKIAVHMPTEEWLCKKLSKLNITLVEGYPSCTAEAGSLPMDHFLRPPRSQAKWYGLYAEQQTDQTKVTSWNTGHSKLNSSFGRIARKAALASTPPASRRISQDSLRRWERTAREASVVCNQAASFNRCLFKVQANMQSQIKTIRSEGKGKGSSKVSEATDELQFLMDFNANISHATAKAMEHLTEFVFFTMGNLTLARRDAYLNHLKNGIKPDTFAALRTGPLHIPTLFPESAIKRAEEEIAHFDSKSQPTASSSRAKARFHPYERQERKQEGRSEFKQESPAWKNIGKRQFRKPKGRNSNFSSRSAKGQQPYK